MSLLTHSLAWRGEFLLISHPDDDEKFQQIPVQRSVFNWGLSAGANGPIITLTSRIIWVVWEPNGRNNYIIAVRQECEYDNAT